MNRERGGLVGIRVAAAAAAMASLLMAGGARAQASSLDRLGWLSGCWELRAGTRTTMEMWMAPAGGLMIGGSRTVAGGAAQAFEHLRIQARGDTLVYTALPSGQAPADFRSTSVSGSEVVFENQAHDFPQLIRYRRVGADSLVARVEGPAAGGATRGFDLAMARVPCPTVDASAPSPDREQTAGPRRG
jgi:hypothetical protein